MGIPNLLRILRDITTRRALSYYKGKRAGIDGYTWLHRSLYCIGDGILKQPKDISRCLNFFIKRIQLLLKNEITPIFIFDGDKLPMKFNEEGRREIKRKEFENESELLLRMNNFYGAINKKIEAFDVTPEFTYEFIKILNIYKIEYYVSPYEADAQLAYLSYINYVDFVITEDSDLVAYGCKCVLYKLGSLKDETQDIGEEILYEKIKNCKEIRFKNFTEDKFLNFCILIGCDYLKIQRVGPKLANEALNKFDDYNRFLGYIFNKNCIQGSISETIKAYEKTFLTFRYQVVYCPLEKKFKYFRDIHNKQYYFLDKYKNDLSFLGNTEINFDLEKYIKGFINPMTKLEIDENNGQYYISKEVCDISKLQKYLKKINEDEDDDEQNYNYNSQDISGENLIHFNFFPKMGKYKAKKNKKNEKPKNQFGIESFFLNKIENKKALKEKTSNKNIINNDKNDIAPKSETNENINNNEDVKINQNNDENKINLSFFDNYIFGIENSAKKRTYKDLDINKNNNRSKDCANSILHLSKAEMDSCYNPLTQYPKTKLKSSIGSKQKEMYKKYNLKFQDSTDKKEKEKDMGLDILNNYAMSETNFNSNKEIMSNPSLQNDLNKKNNNDIKNESKEKKELKKAEEKFIYIGDDDYSEENKDINVIKDEKEENKEKEESDIDNFFGLNLDDYKNTYFTLDKF